MDEGDRLARRFETHRAHLRAVAYRMLGSAAEAEDAVQEAWLRLSRSDTRGVDNLAGWLTTVVARVCLDMLRSGRSRREETIGLELPEPLGNGAGGNDPVDEAVLADSVGRALLVVLETLAPAERIAFVLHDTFAVPFDEIAAILARSPAAAKKLASRARRRVHGRAEVPDADLARHRRVVDAFLAAVRGGDMDALLAVLDPDVVRRTDPVVLPPGAATEVRGPHHVLREAPAFSRHARLAEPALVNGALGALVAPRGQLVLVLTFTVRDDRITEFEVIADPGRLRRLDLAVLAR